MYLVSQKRDRIWNTEHLTMIGQNGISIIGLHDGIESVLAEYDTADRTIEVYKQMMDECFCAPVMVLKNVEIPKELKLSQALIVSTRDDKSQIGMIPQTTWCFPEE